MDAVEKKRLKSRVLLMSVILPGTAYLSHSALVSQSVNSSGDKQHLQDLISFWWTVFKHLFQCLKYSNVYNRGIAFT